MTWVGLAARAAVLRFVAAGKAASQEHVHPQSSPPEKLGTVHFTDIVQPSGRAESFDSLTAGRCGRRQS